MAVMSKPKKSTAAQDKKDRPPAFSLRLGDERDARIAYFIAAQTVEPDKSAVILKAIDHFLDSQGVPKVVPPVK